jgi:CRP-like cAMP-binding protein
MSPRENSYPFADNALLSRLPRPDYDRLRAKLEPVRLSRGRVLLETGETVSHAYFLTGGMVSLLAATPNDDTVQVAMVGSEGVVGVTALSGIGIIPFRVVVLANVTALRINAVAFDAEFKRSGTFHDTLLRYLHTLITQITQSALCNHYHTIEERLCYWLLVSHDRAHSDILTLTQETLAHMLGSQRTGVTAAAASLRRRCLIAYSQGRIHLRDRQGLEARSCECYKVISQEIDKYLAA